MSDTPSATIARAQMPGEDERSLVLSAQAGDPDAIQQLFERYLPRLRRWATGRAAGPRDQTDEVVQQVLMRTLQRLPELRTRGSGAFVAQARQTILFAIRDHGFLVRNQLPGIPRENATPWSPLEQQVGREAVERYESGMSRLPSEERQLVAARLELRMSWEEIAADLGLSSTEEARDATARAIAKLAREMGDVAG